MRCLSAALISIAILSSPANRAQAQEKILDVPYVSTPMEVVREMLSMVNVTQTDLLYDLGCGDGRVVITAAKEHSARGIGVDIDPVRINESNEYAFREGVTDRVKFFEGDLFKIDLSPATVVSFYLMTKFNLQLRPKLFRELKPGTRIVSHNYGMNDWQPDAYTEIHGHQNTHKVYCWIMPANVSGEWSWTLSAGLLNEKYRMVLDQKYQMVSGHILTDENDYPLKNAKLKGSELSFDVERIRDEELVIMAFNGTVEGNTIDGTMRCGAPGKVDFDCQWEPVRDPLTVETHF